MYNDPAFRRKMRKMIEEFQEQEGEIAQLEQKKDRLVSQYRLVGVDEEDVASCNNEMEEIARLI